MTIIYLNNRNYLLDTVNL